MFDVEKSIFLFPWYKLTPFYSNNIWCRRYIIGILWTKNWNFDASL